MKRPTEVCVDCGAKKKPGLHFLTQRCEPCADVFTHYMVQANRAVAKARSRGELSSASEHLCTDCGKQARDWDHRDYTKPLEVEAVCRSCNQFRGVALFPRRIVAATQKA